MALIKWEPSFKGLTDFRKEMDRLFDDFFGRRAPAIPEEEFVLEPSIDLSETDNDIIVKAAIPGVDKKDINIQITNNVLKISGEIKKESRREKEKLLQARKLPMVLLKGLYSFLQM